MKKHLICMMALCVSFSLAGCDWRGKPKEEVHTVDWYTAHPNEMVAKVSECNSNPGELAYTPNCINAQKAQRDEVWGRQGGIHLDPVDPKKATDDFYSGKMLKDMQEKRKQEDLLNKALEERERFNKLDQQHKETFQKEFIPAYEQALRDLYKKYNISPDDPEELIKTMLALFVFDNNMDKDNFVKTQKSVNEKTAKIIPDIDKRKQFYKDINETRRKLYIEMMQNYAPR